VRSTHEDTAARTDLSFKETALLEYIREHNIDDRVLKRATLILRQGGLVAFPTDTSWSVACDIGSKPGLEKLRKLKNTQDFTPTMMTSGFSQWNDFVDLDNRAYRFVKDYAPGPFVFVFTARPSMKHQLGPKRLEVGLRIPLNAIALALINTLGNPLLSITCTKKFSQPGWWTDSFAQEYLFESGNELDDIEAIDLILDSGELLPKVLATVIDMTKDEPRLLRRGIGRIDLLEKDA
jgi:tRNA threonylcarbamoyl adenosine modification protein (Sua5/YciO/YrdC/YwlC family)